MTLNTQQKKKIMWQKKRKKRGGEKAKINSQDRHVVVFLLKPENENLFSAHARAAQGRIGLHYYFDFPLMY